MDQLQSAQIGEILLRHLLDFGYLPAIHRHGLYFTIDQLKDKNASGSYARRSKNLDSLLADFYNHCRDEHERKLAALNEVAFQEQLDTIIKQHNAEVNHG